VTPVPLRVRTLMLHKANVDSRLGLSLRGDGGAPPVVSTSSGVAAAAGLRVGESILSVNGQRIDDHEQATELMRTAVGAVRLRVAPARMDSGEGPKGEAAARPSDTQPVEMALAAHLAPEVAPAPETALPPMSQYFLTIQKATAGSVVGIRLVGRDGCPPYIAQLTTGAAPAAMGGVGLKVGQALLSVNGIPVRSAAAGARALAEAVGSVQLQLGEEIEPGTPQRRPQEGKAARGSGQARRVEGKQAGDPHASQQAATPHAKQPAVAPAALLPEAPAVATGGAGDEARGGKKHRKPKSGGKEAAEAPAAVQAPAGKAATSPPHRTATEGVHTPMEQPLQPAGAPNGATAPKPKQKPKKVASAAPAAAPPLSLTAELPPATIEEAVQPAGASHGASVPKPKAKPKKNLAAPAPSSPAALPPPGLSDMLDARPPPLASKPPPLAPPPPMGEPAAEPAVVGPAPSPSKSKNGRGGGRSGRGRGRG
jgi:hypothetical protein